MAAGFLFASAELEVCVTAQCGPPAASKLNVVWSVGRAGLACQACIIWQPCQL